MNNPGMLPCRRLAGGHGRTVKAYVFTFWERQGSEAPPVLSCLHVSEKGFQPCLVYPANPRLVVFLLHFDPFSPYLNLEEPVSAHNNMLSGCLNMCPSFLKAFKPISTPTSSHSCAYTNARNVCWGVECGQEVEQKMYTL